MSNIVTILREKKGLSKSELARAIGKNRQDIYAVETGHNKLNMKWAELLAPVFGVTPRDILFPRETVTSNRSISAYSYDDGDTDNILVTIEDSFIYRILPENEQTKFNVFFADSPLSIAGIARTDALFVDHAIQHPVRSGVYIVDVGGSHQVRHLSPLTDGQILVQADFHEERVDAAKLRVIGKVAMRLTAM